ncbi:ABC transporter substrate-binding protein [Bifidobacterium primatium]|uniref:ABC transporter substrate-binding protein n=1 Tax=Bifidobacterium primatium TaxID=2045438 RepID=A0A2M9H8K2_9BIFI|nr:transporter substrate-binding domain-containing protein [Bifidobacterium primatium]PJM73138.1 ABC transporter substrate-binding protein [Bifidobacterium primatium]
MAYVMANARCTVRRAAAALLASCMTLTLAGCGQNPLAVSDVIGPRIVIGVTFDQPAMGLRKGSGYHGFNVAVAEYVAEKLGYASWQIVWEQAPEDERRSMLDDGDVDMITGMYEDAADITAGEKDSATLGYDFAGPYLADRQDVMVLSRSDDSSDTSIVSLADLAGHKVCVIEGSETDADLQRRLDGGIRLVRQPGATQCATALLTGMVDAVAAPGSVLAGLADAEGGDRMRLLGLDFAEGGYGIGLRKGSDQLTARIREAIEQMHADGSWDRAYDETLGAIGYDDGRGTDVH